jgi:hypothetical protein
MPWFLYLVVAALVGAATLGLLLGRFTRLPPWVAGVVADAGFIAAYLGVTAIEFIRINTFGVRYFEYDRWVEVAGLIGSFYLPIPTLVVFAFASRAATIGRASARPRGR